METHVAIETPVGLPEPDYSDQEDDIPQTDNLSIPSDLDPSTVQVKDPCTEESSMPDGMLHSVTSDLDADTRDREIPVPDYSEGEEEDQTDADKHHSAKPVLKTDIAIFPSQSNDNNQLTPTDDNTDGGGLISPKKLVNPCLVSKEHKALRQELMLNRKLGKNPTEKPELVKVLKERQEKEKKKELEEHLKSKRTDFDIRLEEQAQKINQAEQLRHQESEQIKKEAEKPEFFKVHSKIIKTKSDS